MENILVDILVGVAGMLALTLTGNLYSNIRRLNDKMDKVQSGLLEHVAEDAKEHTHFATKEEVREKIEDKLEAIKQESSEMKEDIRELKSMVRRLSNR